MKCSRSIKNAHKAHNKEAATKLSLRQLAKEMMHGSRGEVESELASTWRSNKKSPPKAPTQARGKR